MDLTDNNPVFQSLLSYLFFILHALQLQWQISEKCIIPNIFNYIRFYRAHSQIGYFKNNIYKKEIIFRAAKEQLASQERLFSTQFIP